MRIAVMGAGAVGGALGARFAEGGSDVTFIARGEHLRVLQERGLTIVSPEGERSTHVVRAVADPAEVGPVDVVLFLVKSYDTEDATTRLGPLLENDTAVLSLQNGITNEERIAAAIGRQHVLGGAVYILAAIVEPGVVRTGRARIVIGEWQPGAPSLRVERLVQAAEAGGIVAEASADVRLVKWEKYVLLVGFSAVTAATQLTLGDVRASTAATEMMRP